MMKEEDICAGLDIQATFHQGYIHIYFLQTQLLAQGPPTLINIGSFNNEYPGFYFPNTSARVVSATAAT